MLDQLRKRVYEAYITNLALLLTLQDKEVEKEYSASSSFMKELLDRQIKLLKKLRERDELRVQAINVMLEYYSEMASKNKDLIREIGKRLAVIYGDKK